MTETGESDQRRYFLRPQRTAEVARRNTRSTLPGWCLIAVIGLTEFASAADPPAAPDGAANAAPIVWTQLRPDSAGASGQLIARAIVARDAACPTLTVNGASWPTSVRHDGSDPDFPIKYCEAPIPGDAQAQMGDVRLKRLLGAPRKIVVIGDTGCRITDYAAQNCDSAIDWPFFRIAEAASATNPDLVIHLGDYHYREKPCAGRAGCAGSPSGDNWRTWEAELFKPAAPLLRAAPWLMLRGNHEDCSRAGAGWNLLVRPIFGLKPGERCPPDTDPDVFTFNELRMVVPDTASAEGYGRDKRVVTYRNHIRALSRRLAAGGEIWLLTHQALWVSYAWDKGKNSYDTEDTFSRAAAAIDKVVREDVCNAMISPMHTYRQWFDGSVPATNPNEMKGPQERSERPCREDAAAAGAPLAPPGISLVLSGDTHTFQMFAPDDKARPLQLVVGNSGDVLESTADYPGADAALVGATASLFGVAGKLWMRHSFGFVVLEKADTGWTATLHDAGGTAIVRCDLARPNAACK